MQATVSKKSTKETKPKTKKNVGNTVIFCIFDTYFLRANQLL